MLRWYLGTRRSFDGTPSSRARYQHVSTVITYSTSRLLRACAGDIADCNSDFSEAGGEARHIGRQR